MPNPSYFADHTVADIQARNLSPERHAEAMLYLERIRKSATSATEKADARRALDRLIWGDPDGSIQKAVSALAERVDKLEKTRAPKGIGSLRTDIDAMKLQLAELETTVATFVIGEERNGSPEE